MYATGQPKDNSEVEEKETGRTIFMALLTILNITGNNTKLLAIYVMMTLFYTVGAFLLMFFYWKKSTEWRYRKHSHKDKFTEHDIALHSLIVTNLPTETNVQAMSRKVR
jgi:hypothetical protein